MYVLDKRHPVYVLGLLLRDWTDAVSSYLAIKPDAITKYYGVNPYFFAKGVYNTMHTYE